MNLQDRLVSVGGQGSYSIASILGMVNPLNYGVNYYVDGNASASGQGNSWESPFNSLAEALAASHAEIAVTASRHWAKRNAIWMIADAMDEDLTKLAQKTDVIGCGSYNQYTKAGIIGTHVIEAATTAHYMGCRLINLQFRDDGASTNFTLPADQNGIGFIGCDFQRNAGGTVAIGSTSNHDLQILGCNFYPDTSNGKFTTAISIGNGLATNILIKGNRINAGIGIAIDVTPTFGNCSIEDNFIRATTLAIDDNSDDWTVIGNRCISAVATTTAATLVEVIDCNVKLALDNLITAGDITNCRHPILDETGT